MGRKILWMLWAAALLAGSAAFVGAQPVARVSPGKTGDAFLTGAPFTLEQVIRIIGQDAIPLRRRKEAIENRGVDFSMSPAVVARLKAAGAPEDVLNLVKSKAKPAPPPPEPPRPPAQGSVSINCAPAECEVALNGASRGSTNNGALELASIAPGNYAIDLARAGYVTRQNTVTVEAGKTAAVSATLEPTRETLETFGNALFQKVVRALGGQEAMKELSTMQAAGSATVLASDARTVRWALRMRTRGGRALFQATAGALTHEVLFTGSEFTASKSLKGQDALELPTTLGLIHDNQVMALMSRLDMPQYKILAAASDPVAGAEYALTAESGTDKISVGLDSDMRPQRVHITTETGIGSLVITYSDYSQVGHAWYPKSMQVKPDGQQRGVEVHFDSVDLDTKSKDGELRLKGRLFSNFYN
ncbi:MAG TPA: PEGA domain-containing protein [Bryobacteraceae bacterium]|nr:PEGA domain-containing protein [Bryobacteraceae bacterium]